MCCVLRVVCFVVYHLMSPSSRLVTSVTQCLTTRTVADRPHCSLALVATYLQAERVKVTVVWCIIASARIASARNAGEDSVKLLTLTISNRRRGNYHHHRHHREAAPLWRRRRHRHLSQPLYTLHLSSSSLSAPRRRRRRRVTPHAGCQPGADGVADLTVVGMGSLLGPMAWLVAGEPAQRNRASSGSG